MIAALAVEGGRPVRERFLPFHQPLIGADEEASVVETLRSGWITTGPKTKAFECALAEYVGARQVVAVNSCTAALHLALAAVGVGAGDEVITSPITFASTANVIVHCGATPVFADIDADTLNLDPAAFAAAVTPRTKTVIPVHMAGQPCDMRRIAEVAARHGVAVVEDAAHAIGAQYEGRRVGGHGRLACFSFYATKNITSAEGGAIAVDDPALAETIAITSLHGISRDAWKRYSSAGYQHWDILCPGYKYNMSDLQAALALPQLSRIEEFWQRRVALKARLDDGLASLPEIRTYQPVGDVEHAHHLYPLVLRGDRLRADRDTIMNAIQAENVGIGIHFRAVHLHPFYVETFGFARGMFPRAEYYSDRTISLPLYPRMTDTDADDVVAAVRKVLSHYRR